MSYSDLLKDPRWQRKRLETLNRAEFRCEACYDETQTLHVHHMHYERGLKPWEYEDKTLRVLCEGCHWEIGDVQLTLARAMDTASHCEIALLIGMWDGRTEAQEGHVRSNAPAPDSALWMRAFYAEGLGLVRAAYSAASPFQDEWAKARVEVGLTVPPALRAAAAPPTPQNV